MNLEWQQLLTHAVGFLITLWILKKFAWGPLMNLMEERRTRIMDEFKQIDLEKVKVAEQQAAYGAKLKEIEAQRRAEIVKAVEEGKRVAADIKAQAQHEVKELHTKTKAELEREVAKARVELRDQMVTITMNAAEKVIRERLDEKKHRELIDRYIADVEKV